MSHKALRAIYSLRPAAVLVVRRVLCLDCVDGDLSRVAAGKSRSFLVDPETKWYDK